MISIFSAIHREIIANHLRQMLELEKEGGVSFDLGDLIGDVAVMFARDDPLFDRDHFMSLIYRDGEQYEPPRNSHK